MPATLSKQDIFDKVVRGLLKQGKKSRLVKPVTTAGDGTTTCAYRGAEGARCAVGQVIKNRYYRKSMEGLSVSSAPVNEGLIKSGVLDTDGIHSMLDDLQQVHDQLRVREWKLSFRGIAQDHDLDWSVLSEFKKKKKST